MSLEDVVNVENLETERQSTFCFEKRHAISPTKQLKCIGSHRAIHPHHFRFRLYCSLRLNEMQLMAKAEFVTKNYLMI
jgi:hypothetical protein